MRPRPGLRNRGVRSGRFAVAGMDAGQTGHQDALRHVNVNPSDSSVFICG
ncbi:MAG: hypothetical protein PVH31_07940 [Ectothiorhodospiraceae bacterium]|jgi:hypothetical protein